MRAALQGRVVIGRRQLVEGIALVVLGVVVTVGGSVVVHMAESPRFDALGRALFPGVPRGWQIVALAQLVALGGVLLAMAGAAYGFIWQRPLTWARAMFGALLFVGLMFIIFAIVPNQFLTLTQSTLEWTPQKTFVAVPAFLTLNNEISVSFAALKDMISAGYSTTMLIAIPVFMYKWQERAKQPKIPKPDPVSAFGRPLRADR